MEAEEVKFQYKNSKFTRKILWAHLVLFFTPILFLQL